MKSLFNVLIVIAFTAFTFAGSGKAFAQDQPKDDKTATMKCWVSMTCENCKAKVEKNIAYEKGVKDLQVDLPSKIVTIKYRTDKTSPEKLTKAIQKLGYKAEVVKETETK
jgi:copper chaperone CopZ